MSLSHVSNKSFPTIGKEYNVHDGILFLFFVWWMRCFLFIKGCVIGYFLGSVNQFLLRNIIFKMVDNVWK